VNEVKYDMRKFNWLGSQEKGQMMLYVRADSPYKSLDDILKAKEPPKCGGSGASDQSALLTRLLEETIGAKFIRVLGYKGGSEVDLARNGVKSFAALQESPFISAANRFLPGRKKASIDTSSRPGGREIRDSPTCRPSTSSWTNTKRRKSGDAWPT
jgi:hypothetical protein